jgi:heat shock protein HslJ
MRSWLCHWRGVLVPIVALILSACAGSSEKGWLELSPENAASEPVLRITGTVHHLDLEGGLFVIRDAGGTQYNPVNLPETFRSEGVTVEADARRRDNVASIGMVGPVVELLRIRRHDADAGTHGLMGTAWRLEDLAGVGVLDRVQATLEFAETNVVRGNGSCNRFHGQVTTSGGVITFGPLATTRMHCGEAVMRQESEYLAALREARRFEIKGPYLYIFAADRPQPLRMIAADEPGAPPG